MKTSIETFILVKLIELLPDTKYNALKPITRIGLIFPLTLIQPEWPQLT